MKKLLLISVMTLFATQTANASIRISSGVATTLAGTVTVTGDSLVLDGTKDLALKTDSTPSIEAESLVILSTGGTTTISATGGGYDVVLQSASSVRFDDGVTTFLRIGQFGTDTAPEFSSPASATGDVGYTFDSDNTLTTSDHTVWSDNT